MKQLGLLAIVNDRDLPFILEWLWFHHFAGVEQFFLAVRSEEIRNLITALPFTDEIHIFVSEQTLSNIEVCQQLFEKYKAGAEWIIYGDTDEFYFNAGKRDLKEVLNTFSCVDCGGIIVPWTQMGSSDYVDHPRLVSDDLIRQAAESQQVLYKVIVKTSAYVSCHNERYLEVCRPYLYQDGTVFDNYGDKLTRQKADHLIKCHHYFIRGFNDLISRQQQYKEEKNYPCDLFKALAETQQRTEPNTDAVLYSSEIKEALNISRHHATPDNTLFLSVADYEDPERHVLLLQLSAQSNNVPIYWVSYGKKWHGFVQNKYEKVLKYLKRQKDKKYAFFLDSADVTVVCPLQKILDRFNRIYDGGVIFNCDYDGVMWPLADPLLLWHINANYGSNGIANSGCYCGLISDIITLLEQILEVRREILAKDYQSYAAKLFSVSASCGYEKKQYESKGNLCDDDQWLLHILQAGNNSLIKVDRDKQIFAFIESYEEQPRSVYDRSSQGTAAIHHISHIINPKN